MIGFIINFITNNTATLIALIALGISVKSYTIAHRTISLNEKLFDSAKRLKAFEQRTEILEAYDKKMLK